MYIFAIAVKCHAIRWLPWIIVMWNTTITQYEYIVYFIFCYEIRDKYMYDYHAEYRNLQRQYTTINVRAVTMGIWSLPLVSARGWINSLIILLITVVFKWQYHLVTHLFNYNKIKNNVINGSAVWLKVSLFKHMVLFENKAL